jgi:hypothetical protein
LNHLTNSGFGEVFATKPENYQRRFKVKKLIIFILLVAGGYFAYEYLIKEKTVLEINADKSITTQHSMDIDAPALAPAKFASVQGTVKNVSDKTVTNILLKYKLNAKPVEARIDQLEPGETKNFSTQSLRLTHVEVTFFLEEMSYE